MLRNSHKNGVFFVRYEAFLDNFVVFFVRVRQSITTITYYKIPMSKIIIFYFEVVFGNNISDDNAEVRAGDDLEPDRSAGFEDRTFHHCNLLRVVLILILGSLPANGVYFRGSQRMLEKVLGEFSMFWLHGSY